MKLHVTAPYEHLRPQLERLPELFAAEAGELLHAGRNTIRAIEIGGELLAVKRYKRPNPLNTVVYTFFRKSKAQRACEHAQRLREAGFDTPEPVAWSECRSRRGLIADTYFAARYTSWRPLQEAAQRFPAPESRPILEAFARFAAELHERGVEHADFNSTNILYACDEERRGYRFQLIDINRMRFRRRPLPPHRCMINLRRLTCPAPAFLYILDRYAEARDWSVERTLLHGILCRLAFLRRQSLKHKFRRRKKT